MILRHIPRIANVSRQRFTAYLDDPSSPIVLTQVMDDWPAMKRWTLPYFAEAYGNFPVEAFAPQLSDLADWGVRTNIRAYVDYLRDPSRAEIEGSWVKGDAESFKASGQILYAGNFNPAHPRLGRPDLLFRDVPEMPDFIDSWLPLLNPEFVAACCRIQPHYYVYLSAPGAYTPLHSDFWDTHAFLAQVRGLKRAMLFEPKHDPLLLSHPTRDVRQMLDDERYALIEVWQADLGPGELLVVPSRWLHAVETIEPSITYSADWVDGANWRAYVRSGRAALRRHSHAT